MKTFIYDRDHDMRKFYHALLQPYRAQIVFADTLHRAKRNSKLADFDLYLWDVGFPEMEGMNFMEALGKKAGERLVLTTSMPFDKPTEKIVFQFPYKKMLAKPFDVNEVRQIMLETARWKAAQEETQKVATVAGALPLAI